MPKYDKKGFIVELEPNEVFVFGSNAYGAHAGGAAMTAVRRFGAINGQSEGLQGQSYAINTMSGKEEMFTQIKRFLRFAFEHQELTFYVTELGCGIAGYSPAEVAPAFVKSPRNVILPESFRVILKDSFEPRFERKLKLANIFRHTQKIYESSVALHDDLEKSMRNAKHYGEDDYPAKEETGERPVIEVTSERTFESALRLKKETPDAKIAVLNFASATNPGGGVKGGSGAQEESLCRVSTLYPTLDQDRFWEQYYDKNRREWNATYTDACIYSPGVVVFKSDTDYPEMLPQEEWKRFDVITCAAPNLSGRTQEEYPLDVQYDIHLRRAEHILSVAAANSDRILVLGAFGCGAFWNNPEAVAKAYNDATKKYSAYFDKIVFAIYHREHEQENYQTFKKIFS
jgi:uncharacterized protein (TIGR02452 family)